MRKFLLVAGLLASMAVYAEGNKVEVRAGFDFGSTFQHNYYDVSEDAKFSYELGAEYRRELPYNFELGAGLAYQDHGKLKSQSNYRGSYSYTTEGDLYDSIPLYVTGRYNFKNSTEITPYIKANVGYSFNMNDGTMKLKYNDGTQVDLDVEAKNGFYYGLGAGVTYKGFVADLSYQANFSDVDFKSNGTTVESSKADFSRVTLGLGYTFGF